MAIIQPFSGDFDIGRTFLHSTHRRFLVLKNDLPMSNIQKKMVALYHAKLDIQRLTLLYPNNVD